MGFLRRGANMSFRIYKFCIHLGERILSLGDMKTFCVWGMSRIFCGASWLAILSFIGQLWTHHYRQISFPPIFGWDLRAKRIFCKWDFYGFHSFPNYFVLLACLLRFSMWNENLCITILLLLINLIGSPIDLNLFLVKETLWNDFKYQVCEDP